MWFFGNGFKFEYSQIFIEHFIGTFGDKLFTLLMLVAGFNEVMTWIFVESTDVPIISKFVTSRGINNCKYTFQKTFFREDDEKHENKVSSH